MSAMGRNSSRISLGGGSLRDSSSRYNCRSVSVPKRVSLGFNTKRPSSNSTIDEIEPKKDRRKLLEEWRQQVRARESSVSASNSSCVSFDHEENNHNIKHDTSLAIGVPLPMTSFQTEIGIPTPISNNITLEASTALERFRLRRKQKHMHACGRDDIIPSLSIPPQPPSTSLKRNSICFEDDDIVFLGARTGTTLSIDRRLTISSGAKRRRTKVGRSLAPDNLKEIPSKEIVFPTLKGKSDNILDRTDEVEGPGLQSRFITMEKRIQELEKEKMALSMSKAPLEARLRQKEDQWTKEKSKYEHEIHSLKADSKKVDEKYKKMEMQVEALQEETAQLRYESRKQKTVSTLGEEYEASNYSCNSQLQNDRFVVDLNDKLRHAEEEIKSLRLEKVSAESEVHATNLELSAILRDYDELRADYDEILAKKESNSEAGIQLQELTKEHTATLAQLNATTGELASLRSQSKFEIDLNEKQWDEEREKLLFEMSVLKSRAASFRENDGCSEIDTDVEDEAVLRARIEERDRRIDELESQLLKLEHIRRIMHNRIQELRGNIRVFVRTRPFLPGDEGSEKSSIHVLPDGENLSIIDLKSNKYFEFNFDKVFPPSSGQSAVFDEVSEFVQSALDGYHVCLFSYGQTGSGKTHTMQGSGNGAMRGIIPRAVEQILSQAKSMKNQKWNFNMTASFLEIYNENLRDLLISMKHTHSSKSGSSSKLSIRRNSNKKSYVEGLTQIAIDTDDPEAGMEDLKAVMTAAARSRSVASTKMNARSSRSHSVFMLQLNGVNEDNGSLVEGTLNLCDLAGSERLDRSGAGSNVKRLKETQSINKSLSCLGDVFNALANGACHIPFRNSKLTFLLQDCLSGDGKALMFVNLSPTMESSNESLCSLRLAQRVNQVELGKAMKNIEFTGRIGEKR